MPEEMILKLKTEESVEIGQKKERRVFPAEEMHVQRP